MSRASAKIIVPLDVNRLEQAEALLQELSPEIHCFKIGLELLTAVGAPRAVEMIHRAGGEVFLDGKFCDIPNTVRGAARAASQLKVKMFNVHANCGFEAMEAAAKVKGDSLLLAVTVLTSLGDEDCTQTFGAPVSERVIAFAQMAAQAGADGLICSPADLPLLAEKAELKNLRKVTPGVRPEWAQSGDQKRFLTPYQAIRAGATELVIGRPITSPPPSIGSPQEAVRRISQEIEQALGEER